MSADLFDAFTSPPKPTHQPAQDAADDDDWGDFSGTTGVTSPIKSLSPVSSSSNVDLLFGSFASSAGAPPPPKPIASSFAPLAPTAPRPISTSFPNFSSFSSPPPPPTATAATAAKNNIRATPVQKTPAAAAAAATDDFGDFIYTPRIPTPPPQEQPFTLSKPLNNPNYNHPSTSLPPIHAMLQLLSGSFLLPGPLLAKLKGLSYPQRQRVLSHPKTKDFFAGIVAIARVAGRIIAGRKNRAKRVGGGGGSGSGGMNLKAKGKPDAMRDEREAREAVRLWAEAVGGLRAAVVNTGITVPDIEFDMAVVRHNNPSSSVGSAGGLLASTSKNQQQAKKIEEVCWLCGLLRMETVPKLREEGTGSLSHLETKGDPEEKRWINGWGHRGCRNWWEGEGVGKLG